MDRHLGFRKEMTRAALHVIQVERITVNFIIYGLSAGPRCRPHITLLLTSRSATIRAARQLRELFNTNPHHASAETISSPPT